MKKMTCRDLGGACDALITGSTPEEMGENAKKHAQEMVQKGDQPHIDAMEKMGTISPEEFQKFWTGFLKKFADAEEV